MGNFLRSTTWIRTLGQRDNDSYEPERALLRNSFLALRERAKYLVSEIAGALPNYTVHDISHLDALWDYADLILGDNFPLTPAEGFLLGAAFMLHDAGMSIAAYPGGVDAIKNIALWKDTRATKLSKFKEPNSLDVERIERETTADILRVLHAERAEILATQAWIDRNGNENYLIENSDVRLSFGQSVGQVAKSHWLDIQDVLTSMNRISGAPSFLPPDWSFDLLKISCVLRACDAAHLDSRRAPHFLRTLRQPDIDSDKHWVFQSLLTRPVISGDRIQFSSARAMSEMETESWWLCLETLRMIDRELRSTDAVLADSRQNTRFRARGVANVESPSLMVRTIPVSNWVPVDASLRVSDLPSIVKSLGGAELYGDNPFAAIRELVQNACDAIRARRMLENRPPDWGEVIVRLIKQDGITTLEVTDSGIGMSLSTITEKLLDFGSSYWGSELSRRELPGLASKGFLSVGKFGIGFYAVFMLGEEVELVTRRPDAPSDKTLSLQFGRGVTRRPLVKFLGGSQALIDPGTKVRVRLSHDVVEKLKKDSETDVFSGFTAKCVQTLPACDVNIIICDDVGNKVELFANSWIDCSSSDLARRVLRAQIYSSFDLQRQEIIDVFEDAATNEEMIIADDGSVLGRGFIYVDTLAGAFIENAGTIVVGGLAAEDLRGLAGIFLGNTDRMARDSATLIGNFESYVPWIKSQIAKLEPKLDRMSAPALADLLVSINFYEISFPWIRTGRDSLYTISQVVDYTRRSGIFIAVDESLEYSVRRSFSEEGLPLDFSLDEGVFVLERGMRHYTLNGKEGRDVWGRESRYDDQLSFMLRCVLKGWGMGEDSISMRNLVRERIKVGIRNGEELFDNAFVFRRQDLLQTDD